MSRIEFWKQRLNGFLFSPESDNWLSILRFGLGLQVILYCLSIRRDWTYLLADSGGLISRNLSEIALAFESPLIPRLGWLVGIGSHFGLGEESVLSLIWWCLIAAGCLLFAGLYSRSTAVAAWLLHLGAVKSSELISYGVDNLTTIGLFYLMLSPLPDRFSLDYQWRKKQSKQRQLLGFWRRVLQLHLCLIYFFGGLTKALGAGWWNGANLWRALIRPPFALIPTEVLVRAKYIFPIAGIGVLVLELGYIVFIWPLTTRRVWLLCILFIHLVIGLAMGMYLFALIMILLNLAAFGPGSLWHQPEPTDDALPSRPQ